MMVKHLSAQKANEGKSFLAGTQTRPAIPGRAPGTARLSALPFTREIAELQLCFLPHRCWMTHLSLATRAMPSPSQLYLKAAKAATCCAGGSRGCGQGDRTIPAPARQHLPGPSTVETCTPSPTPVPWGSTEADISPSRLPTLQHRSTVTTLTVTAGGFC